MESPAKRPRIEQSTTEYSLEDDDYEPYIPIAKRRQEKFNALASSSRPSRSSRRVQLEPAEENNEELDEEEAQRERARRERTLLMEAQEVHQQRAAEGSPFTKPSRISIY